MSIRLTAKRGYRVIKSIQLLGDNVIPSGTLMYCDRLSRGHGSMHYLKGDNLMVVKLPAGVVTEHVVFTKLASLPERVRTRFGIREDGTRAVLNSGSVYAYNQPITINGYTIEPGAPLLCLKGGERPQLSFVDGNGNIDYMECPSHARVTMVEIPAVPCDPELAGLEHTFHYKTEYRSVGERPIFELVLTHGEHALHLSRRSKTGSVTYGEVSGSATRPILGLLKTANRETKCSPATLFEAYVTYLLYGNGIAPFSTLMPGLVRSIEQQEASRKQAGTASKGSGAYMKGNGFYSRYDHRSGRFTNHSYRR